MIRRSTTPNYEIDKTVKRTVGGGGRVNRLTVSVVVDHKNVNDTQVARTADELQKIQSLLPRQSALMIIAAIRSLSKRCRLINRKSKTRQRSLVGKK